MSKGCEKYTIPSDILDDLSSRFIVNIPEEEKREPTRLCFQIELAYWFYLDFFCAEDPSLKTCGMKEFTAKIFEHVSFLTPLLKNLDKIIEDWRIYKSSVPTYGAVILNEDLTKVLLVQSFFTRASWGFPKGKVNELESPSNCAVREVMEETGLDISKLIDENDYIEATLNEHTVRLYMVSGVSENVKLQPKTRNEIKRIEWFVVNDLPMNKKDMITRIKFGVGPNTFFLVLPFIKKVRHWIHEKRQEGRSTNKSGHSRRHRHKSVGEIPANFAPLQPMQSVQKNKKQFQLYYPTQSEFVQNNSNGKNPSVPKNKPFKQEKRSNSKRQLFNDDERSQELQYKQNMSELNEGIKNCNLNENNDNAASTSSSSSNGTGTSTGTSTIVSVGTSSSSSNGTSTGTGTSTIVSVGTSSSSSNGTGTGTSTIVSIGTSSSSSNGTGTGTGTSTIVSVGTNASASASTSISTSTTVSVGINTDNEGGPIFYIPMWLNFKLDREAILKCFNE